MNRIFDKYLLTILLIATSAGCGSIWHNANLDYRTVAADPNIDTDKAKAENLKARKWMEKGRDILAERALQKALIADVTYGPAHNNLGKLYYCQGKHYLAAWEFEYAIKLMPDHAEPYNNLGIVYETVGKLDEAVELYANAKKLQSTHPEIIGNLARASLRRGDDFAVIKPLLCDLTLYDTRPDWIAWAKHQLVFSSTEDAPPTMEILPTPPAIPQPNPSVTPEQIPPGQPQSLPTRIKENQSDKITRHPTTNSS